MYCVHMSKNLVPASLTFPNELLADIDKRAEELDMNRSQYLRYLARKDLAGAKKDRSASTNTTAVHDEPHQQAA